MLGLLVCVIALVLKADARPQFSFSDPGFEELQKSEKAADLQLSPQSGVSGDSSTASTVDANLDSPGIDDSVDSPSIFSLLQSFFG